MSITPEVRSLFVELLQEKTYWMKIMRIVIVSLLLLAFIALKFVLGIPYRIEPLVVLALIALFYNFVFMVVERGRNFETPFWPRVFASVRTLFDLAEMTAVMYFTGSFFSPFIFVFILSVIGYIVSTSSLPLSLLMVGWGAVCYIVMFALVHNGLVPPYPIVINAVEAKYLLAQIGVFIVSLVFAAIMLTRIVKLIERAEFTAANAKDQYNRARAETLDKMAELEKMNSFMIGRELRMVDLKREVNGLLKELNRPDKYEENKVA